MPDVMPQLQSPPDTGGLSDHETDAELELGGRRRAVADWGADDLFDHTPRRRRSASSLAARERRISGPIEPRFSRPRDDADAVPVPARPASSEPATVTRIESAPSYAADAPVAADAAQAAVGEIGGRRTVTITGRPEALPRGASPARRRPPRTVEERIGHRPDRLAGWAVGLGMMLLLIAVGTADAAPL